MWCGGAAVGEPCCSLPGDVTWVDVIIPAHDPLWCDDVGRAFDWLGDAWAAALSALGVEDPRPHRGPMRRTAWSDLVCFAGVGRGEVIVAGRKVLGISQRRTRSGARFQCAVLHRWDPVALVNALALDPEDRRRAAADLRDVAAGILVPEIAPDGSSGLESAFMRQLRHGQEEIA